MTTATLSEPEPSPVKGRGRDVTPRRGKTTATAGGRSGSPSVHRPKEVAVNRNAAAHREPTEMHMKSSESGSPATTSVAPAIVSAKAPLVVLCDGSGSNFRRKVNINGEQDYTPHSHFVGLIVKGAKLPHETKGHVFLGKDGPILAYRLDPNEVRFLIDYKGPALPGNKLPAKDVIQKWLNDEIVPQLPDGLRTAFQAACAHEDQIRSMPTPFFTQLFPKHKGMVALGDHQNQRHPLTGGGMTCAFRDVIELTKRLNHIPDFAANLKEVQRAVDEYTVERCRSVGCINILSWALYAVFEGPKAMRRACFHYFFLGGDAVAGPMSMLSGLRSSVPFLLYHYYRVMFYGTYLVMTHDTNVCLTDSQPLYMRLYWFLTFFVSPWRIFTTIHLLAYSTRVFIPLLFREFTPMAKFFRGTK
jgi:squalene monooxygenase